MNKFQSNSNSLLKTRFYFALEKLSCSSLYFHQNRVEKVWKNFAAVFFQAKAFLQGLRALHYCLHCVRFTVYIITLEE